MAKKYGGLPGGGFALLITSIFRNKETAAALYSRTFKASEDVLDGLPTIRGESECFCFFVLYSIYSFPFV